MRSIDDVRSFFQEVTVEMDNMEEREKLKFLLEFGDNLKQLPIEERRLEYKVSGCVSDVYVKPNFNSDNTIDWEVYSGALFVRGFVGLLKEALDGLSKDDFLAVEGLVRDFVKNTGFVESLVQSRANAIGNIYLKMKELVD